MPKPSGRPVELGNAWEMLARVAMLALAVGWVGLATPALATPRCTKTYRRETVGCERTRCATLRGPARQDRASWGERGRAWANV